MKRNLPNYCEHCLIELSMIYHSNPTQYQRTMLHHRYSQYLWLNIMILSLAILSILIDQSHAMDFVNHGVAEHETVLTIEDFKMAEYVSDGHLSKRTNPLLRAGKFEGDIDGISALSLEDDDLQKNAIRNKHLIWPSGKIPYTISSRYSSMSRARIAAAMQEYAKRTCIRFVPHQNEHDYVYIFPGQGCYSMVGKVGGQQRISIGRGCVHKGIIMHELMHAVGFFHEQSRTDRDDHVSVKWENIISGMSGQFRKYNQLEIQYLGTNYDYGSIMHYGPRDFSKNGLPTIVPRQHGAEIGQRRGFSVVDREKLNRLYKCPDPGVEGSGESEEVDTSDVKPKRCEDRLGNCRILAANGGCRSAPAWMAKWCPVSCHRCRSTVKPKNRNCQNRNGYCDYWTRKGYCDSFEHSHYMILYCTKSCKKC